MIIIHENLTEAALVAKNYTEKLKRVNSHLRNLLSKKLTLELEIRELRVSIKKRSQEYDIHLKTKSKLKLEETLSLSKRRFLAETSPESLVYFLEYNSVQREVLELLREDFECENQ